jgi:hypothetical protein
VGNEEECVCSVYVFRCNIFIGFRIIKEMPGLVGSGTPYIIIARGGQSPTRALELMMMIIIIANNLTSPSFVNK